MGTIRHQHALIFGAALFAAATPALAQAESFSVSAPAAAPAQLFVPSDCLAALPVLVQGEASFDRPIAFLDAGAVAVAVRADTERLAAPAQDVEPTVVAVAQEAPIERRITLVFARFENTDAEARATADANRAQNDFAAAARRWTPAVSSMQVALALPVR
jgi:hypothetical protein